MRVLKKKRARNEIGCVSRCDGNEDRRCRLIVGMVDLLILFVLLLCWATKTRFSRHHLQQCFETEGEKKRPR